MTKLITILLLLSLNASAQRFKSIVNPTNKVLVVDFRDSVFMDMKGKEQTIVNIAPYSSWVGLFVRKIVVLPVRLLSFTATVTRGVITFKWSVDVDGVIVYHSYKL